MDLESLAGKDARRSHAPAMHTVLKMLAEAEEMFRRNDQLIARCRQLARQDVLGAVHARRRKDKRTLG